MAGTAKTNAFMLGTATVMIGPQSSLFDLNPADHSIGLVKNFSMTSEPNYQELTQGVKNTIVYSVMTQNPVRASMEVYEYTAKNLAYGLGLDGSTKEPLIDKAVVADEVEGDGSVKDVTVDSAASFEEGDFVVMNLNNDDHLLVRKVTTVVSEPTPTLTLDKAIPDGTTIAAGTTVQKVNVIGVGSKEEQPFLAAKVVGVLADGTRMAILIPKVRIVRGFNLAFTTDDYGNLPFEFTVYDLVDTDPFFADFGGDAARLFRP